MLRGEGCKPFWKWRCKLGRLSRGSDIRPGARGCIRVCLMGEDKKELLISRNLKRVRLCTQHSNSFSPKGTQRPMTYTSNRSLLESVA